MQGIFKRVVLGSILVLGGVAVANAASYGVKRYSTKNYGTKNHRYGTDHKGSHLLSCDKLDHILLHFSSADLRPYCDLAERRCKARALVSERPKEDVLRQEVEENLEAEIRYLLDICEIALRKIHPSYLKDRP